ncbi:MAG: hypothetical protein V1781_06220 [Bacteroidota bacterium]
MADKFDDIKKFFESIPDKYDILEEGIDIKIQKEYIKHSHTFDCGELTEKETLGLSNILFDKDEPADKKKKVLSLLAHLGTILAFRQIEKCYKYLDKDLKQWATMALQECKIFLENNLLDENKGLILSGLGGLDNKLRYYFLVLSSTNKPFTKTQKDIIRDEFPIVCKELNSIIETIDFSDTYVGLTALVSIDVAIGTVIETGIKKCNELGNFVFEHYYVTNQNIPDKSEINDIIKIVKG